MIDVGFVDVRRDVVIDEIVLDLEMRLRAGLGCRCAGWGSRWRERCLRCVGRGHCHCHGHDGVYGVAVCVVGGFAVGYLDVQDVSSAYRGRDSSVDDLPRDDIDGEASRHGVVGGDAGCG